MSKRDDDFARSLQMLLALLALTIAAWILSIPTALPLDDLPAEEGRGE